MDRKIKTTVVGSYPIPHWLRGARSDRSTLRDAALVAIRTQELAGIDVVTDGEISRFDPSHPETNGMIDFFIGSMSGIESQLSISERKRFRERKDMQFRSRPAGVVRGHIGAGSLNLLESWETVADLASSPLKFTVTSPYMLAKTLFNEFYKDIDELVMRIAEVLANQVAEIPAPFLQVDEANLPGNPGDWQVAAKAINTVIERFKGEGAGVHLCFGNYGGQTIQQGFWQDLIPFFNSLKCDHLILECARRDLAEIGVFKELRNGLNLGLGVVDIKDNSVESPELIASRIEEASRLLGPERIEWIHPDCGFWMLQRSVADAKMKALVRGRDLFQGTSEVLIPR